MTIKVFEKVNGCFPLQLKQGDWCDLFTAEDIKLAAPQANKMHIRKKGKNQSQELRTRDVDFSWMTIPLGVCMEIPAGYEAYLLPRSSTFKKYGILQTNSMGIIDNSYAGPEDEWKLPVMATREIIIPKGTRIAQFRIQLKQQANFWQKLCWLFSSGITLKRVSSLSKKSRGGFGSTGK